MKITGFFLTTFLSLIVSYVFADIDENWLKENYNKKEIYIPMRDGVKLFTTIYSPKISKEKSPVLMMRTPYSIAPYGEGKYSSRLYKTHWKKYLQENYIIVMQDVRGKYMSEGIFEDVRPFNPNKQKKTDIDEASDTYDTVDWLLKNIENNNGNVGVFGISYPGFYATMAALSYHPAIKAVSPQAPVTDWFMGDDFHHNGAFMLMDGFNFYSSFGVPRPKPTTESAKGFNFPTKDLYQFYLEQGSLSQISKLMGDSIKFWSDLMKHPNYDDFWKKRDARRNCNNIKSATLVVGGLFDAEDCYGAWRLYEAIEKQNKNNNKIVMGPWSHGGWARSKGDYLGNIRFGSNTAVYYQDSIEFPFFQKLLKGISTKDSLAEATVFFTGENKWKKFNSWPPSSIQYKLIYTLANDKLSFEGPKSEAPSFSSYTSNPMKPVPYSGEIKPNRTNEYMTDDQRFANWRTDVLSFSTSELTEALTIAGTVKVSLKTSISTTDADFIVKLIDVFPAGFDYDTLTYGKGNGKNVVLDGYQMLVRGEVMRGKFRNSFENPEPFEPGKITEVNFDLPDVAHMFLPGHKIMVQIQSTWFPLVDRNPQQFTDIYNEKNIQFIPSEIKIYHDKVNATSIQLPVLK